jgi:hypothetical protein
VFRPIQIIVNAILLSRPTMPIAEANRYAHVLQDEAVKYSYDPLTAVSIIHFESRWYPGAVSRDGEDFGLGQVRARWYGACRKDADPVHAPSPGCQGTKASLLNGENNLRRMSVIIAANRELCKEKAGKANLPQWLAGYEGYNIPSRDRWCAPGSKTWQVVEYRKQLIAQLAPPPPPPPSKTPARRTAHKAPPSTRRATQQNKEDKRDAKVASKR